MNRKSLHNNTPNKRLPKPVQTIVEDSEKLADAFMAVRDVAHELGNEGLGEVSYNLSSAHARLAELLQNYDAGSDKAKSQAGLLAMLWTQQFDTPHDFAVLDAVTQDGTGNKIRDELQSYLKHSLTIAMREISNHTSDAAPPRPQLTWRAIVQSKENS